MPFDPNKRDPNFPERKSSSRRLTPDEKEQICILRAQGVSQRETAKRCDTTEDTVKRTYKKYLDATWNDRYKNIEREREMALQRILRIANDCYRAGTNAEQAKRGLIHAQSLDAELRAMNAFAKLSGIDRPERFEHKIEAEVKDMTELTEEEIQKLAGRDK
jgi:hypothetical protein